MIIIRDFMGLCSVYISSPSTSNTAVYMNPYERLYETCRRRDFLNSLLMTRAFSEVAGPFCQNPYNEDKDKSIGVCFGALFMKLPSPYCST